MKNQTFKPSIKFFGACGVVTGSNVLINIPSNHNKKGYISIICDIGIMQGGRSFEEIHKFNVADFNFDIDDIDAVVLSHAHSDHISRLPLLIKRGYKGKVLATEPTARFAKLNMQDFAYLNEKEVIRINKKRKKNKLKVVYSQEDALESLNYIRCYGYNQEIFIDKDISIIFKPAGHMLGAASIHIKYVQDGKIKRISYSGDNSGKKVKKPFLPIAEDFGKPDTLILESTYGDRFHKKENTVKKLSKFIQETCIDNKKTLLIPVFSLQRSSELMWLLRESYFKNDFGNIPIYLDTPMGINSQEIMDNGREFWGKNWLKRDKELGNLFEWSQIKYVKDYKESQALSNGIPKIILSSSGMVNGGRIVSNHISSFLPSKGCMILFTGFQAPTSFGHKILHGKAKTVSINGKQLVKRATVEQLSLSSHADQDGLIEMIKTCNLKKLKTIILHHGDSKSRKVLQDRIKKEFTNIEVVTPQIGEKVKI